MERTFEIENDYTVASLLVAELNRQDEVDSAFLTREEGKCKVTIRIRDEFRTTDPADALLYAMNSTLRELTSFSEQLADLSGEVSLLRREQRGDRYAFARDALSDEERETLRECGAMPE